MNSTRQKHARSGPIPLEGHPSLFPRGGTAPRDRLHRLIDEYGHGSSRRLPLHRNPGLEIVYLKHGHLVWQYEGHKETLTPDTIFFTLPWEAHGSASEFEPGHEWFFAVLNLKGLHLDQPGPFTFPAGLAIPDATARSFCHLLRTSSKRVWPATTMIRNLFPALIRELEAQGPFHERYATHMTSLLVIELARILAAGTESNKPSSAADRIGAFLTELERRYDEPWTLEGMAEQTGLKRTQFSALFHHHTGDTPVIYLNRLRIKQARQLLSTTDHPITEIAFDCGFSSCQYFANVFHAFTGTTASSYRRRRVNK